MTDAPGIGHNSDKRPKATTDAISENPETGAELKQFIERIQRLEEEKKALGEDVKDIYSELKGRGFDAKVVRKIIAELKQDPSERKEFAAIYELYAEAIGLDFML